MKFIPESPVLRRFALSHFFIESQFWFPVWMLFLSYRGFDLTTMVLADGVFRFTMVAMEYPMGVFSDRIGRKRTYILINILAVMTYGGIILIKGSAMLFSVWILWGFFWALSSGASSAYCYELIENTSVKNQSSFEIFGFMRAISSAAALFSHLAAGFLFVIAPEWPFIINGLFAVGGLLLTISLPDTSITGRSSDILEPNTFQEFFSIIRHNPTFFAGSLLLAVALIYFWSPRILIQPLFLELEISSAWISMVYFFYSLAGVIAGLMAARVRNLYGNRLAVFMGIGIIWVGVMLVALAPGCSALFFIPLMSFGYYISHTLLEVLLHQELENRHRASMFSAVSFIGGVFIIVSRPGLGILADLQNSQFAFLVWTVLGVAVLVLSGILVQKLPQK